MKKKSIEEIRRLMAKQKRSGLSQRAFCKRHGVSLSTFNNYKKRVVGPAPDSFRQIIATPTLDIPQYSFCVQQGNIKIFFNDPLAFKAILRELGAND